MNEAQAAVLMLLAAPLLWGLMWVGWRRRGRRQGGLPPLPVAPQTLPGDRLPGVEATYVSTTPAGQPLDRVVARGLGARSAAVVRVGSSGVLVERRGAPDVWIAADSLLGVRLERGMVGKFVGPEGLVVLTWKLGDTRLDTGLRTRHRVDRERLLDAVAPMTGGAR